MIKSTTLGKLSGVVYLMLLLANLYAQNPSINRIYEVWDDCPAPNRGSDYGLIKAGGYPYDADWEMHSYPLGNGYMGANVFGRTDTERIQITEKTLANEGLYGIGGLTGFAELFLEINHHNPTNYKRLLNLNEAVMYVNYKHNGVNYTREYFASYPDNIIVVKLSADKKEKISFTLRPQIPHLRSAGEKNTRTGKTVAKNDKITLSGNIAHFNINYECQIKVINEGGQLVSQNSNGTGEIRVVNANAAVIIIGAGTNYELSENIFLENANNKKLDGNIYPHEKVSSIVDNAASKGFRSLKDNHLKDYQNLFSRVKLIFSPDVPQVTTKELVEKYKSGGFGKYLEELMFHFGRYLLISSSRKGTLPTGLQGVWSHYAVTPWTGGYWHNINVQMNYWGAFNSNLAETFVPYLEYFRAYLPKATLLADEYIKSNNPEKLTGYGSNGWTIGTGASAYKIGAPGGHSGPGTGGFTAKLLWDYFDFTRDTSYLLETGYPALLGMGRFLSKTLKPAGDKLLLVDPSASPEQKHYGENYITKGTTFDQGFVWETYNDLLKAARIIGAEEEFLNTLLSEINMLDPILIGKSGQVKEFREENEYGEIGERHHRHVSHLCPLYPGTLITTKTQEWMKGVITALDYRGNETTGWAMAHRMNLQARTREADKAHEVYSKFLKERTLPNLWTVHPPFQIDGNFGTMAGVTEMLLQSHENCIEPLPALPAAWKNGEFSGLVARGNFEIAAKWDNGKASYIEIISRSGGTCSLKYTDIGNARITDNTGKAVPFTVLGKNSIEFKTRISDKFLVSF